MQVKRIQISGTINHAPYPRPFTLPTCNIRITAITIHDASTHIILFEIKSLWIGHAIENLAQGALFFAPRADQQLYGSSTSFSGHGLNVGEGTDTSVTDHVATS